MKTVGTADLAARLGEPPRAVRHGEAITVLDAEEPLIVPPGAEEGGLVVIPATGSFRDVVLPVGAVVSPEALEEALRAERADRL